MDRLLSHVDRMIESTRSGQPIDWDREATVLELETVRIGVEFASETEKREVEADDDFEKSLKHTRR